MHHLKKLHPYEAPLPPCYSKNNTTKNYFTMQLHGNTNINLSKHKNRSLTLKLGHSQNSLPPFFTVLAVLNTTSTPQLHVGASPNPLHPPLLQDKL